MSETHEQFEQAVQSLRVAAVPSGPSESLMRQTLNRIEQLQDEPLPRSAGKRSLFMQSLKKLSVAAILVIGMTTFLVLNRTPGSIALADVYTRVQQARTFMYTMSMTMSGMGEMMGLPDAGSTTAEGTIIISTEHGMKMESQIQTQKPGGSRETITQLAYMLPNDKVIISVMPEQKIYQKIELTDQLLEETKKQNNDPREMIRQMMNCEYVSLGHSEINGVKVQGFETTDPAYNGGIGGDVRVVLWVDAATWLPVQSEASMTMGEKMKIDIVICDFQWDVPVDAAEFVFVIPDDYKEFGSFKMPEMNEEAAVEGLQLYVNLFDQYPDTLDIASLVPSLMKNLKELMDNPTTEYAKEFTQRMKNVKAGGDQAVMQQVQQVLAPITSLALFYANLSQNKHDPAYYGRMVTYGDGAAVLLRWREDSGRYKVIFGDLSVSEMSYDELVAIEPEIMPADEPNTETPAEESGNTAVRLESMTNIKRLLLACYTYEDNNGDWPDTLESLLGKGIEPELLVNPARPDLANGYIYIKPAFVGDLQSDFAKTIVIYEAYETWDNGVNAGFADGHVEFMGDEADFLTLLSH